MGRITDLTAVQFRMLNRSKGAAMWSPRAQCDKSRFSAEWRRTLENTPNLYLWQDTAVELLFGQRPPQPETSETRPASEVVRFSPNEGKRDYSVLFGNVTTRIPLRRKDLRESRHYRHGLRPRTNDRRMTDIEIYDCRGKSIFFREPVPNKRRIRP